MTKEEQDKAIIQTLEKVKEIHKVLFGNGQKGINERFIVVENNQKLMSKWMYLIIGAIIMPFLLKLLNI